MGIKERIAKIQEAALNRGASEEQVAKDRRNQQELFRKVKDSGVLALVEPLTGPISFPRVDRREDSDRVERKIKPEWQAHVTIPEDQYVYDPSVLSIKFSQKSEPSWFYGSPEWENSVILSFDGSRLTIRGDYVVYHGLLPNDESSSFIVEDALAQAFVKPNFFNSTPTAG